MKKVILAAFLFCSTLCYGDTTQDIKDFYTAYIGCLMDGKYDELTTLKKMNLSSACYEKLARVTLITNSDPIIRGQDVNEDMLESVSVEDIGNNWYLVSFFGNRTKRSSLTVIPVKAIKNNDRSLIVYVTPIWNGSAVGDYSIRKIMNSDINYNSESDFIESFYRSYLCVYCNTSNDLLGELNKLRLQACTLQAQADFEAEQLEHQKCGECGYDAFIDNFDFDVNWFDSMTISNKDENQYVVKYYGEGLHSITVSIKKFGKKYFIDHVCPEPKKAINPYYIKKLTLSGTAAK